MIKRLKLIIKGKVQGIGFREYIKLQAEEIGALEGTVQNLPDGTVETVVSGESESVETLIDKIYVGNKQSKVDSVEAVPIRVPKNFRGAFRVIG